MKKYILIAMIALVPLTGFSQSLFDKYEDMDEVTSAVVSGKMFKLLAQIDIDTDNKELNEYKDIANKVTGLQFFTTENQSIATQMESDVRKYIRSSSLEELMRVKDEDVNLKFYVKSTNDDTKVSELLMFINGFDDIKINRKDLESVMVRLTGDIDLNKINALTKKMNLPEELNKAGKKDNR